MARASLLFLAVFCSGALTGCAGGKVARIDTTTALPEEVSKDLQRFEVKDSMLATPAATATQVDSAGRPAGLPEGAPKAEPTKVKKQKKGKSAAAAKVSADEVVSVAGEASGGTFPSRRPQKDPIWVGEKAVYDITYFGVQGGEFSLEVMPYKQIDNRKVYHIHGTAISSKLFSIFYRLNDTVETFLDYDGLFSHRFHIVLDESKQTRDSLELYDSVKKQTFYWNRWNHYKNGYTETKQFAPIPVMPQDTLSALYYLRTLPLPDGAVLTVPIVSEAKSWEAVVTVVKRETIDTPMGRMATIVVKPEMKFQGILKKQGDSFLWLSDDDRRFLVRIEAKVKIGTVVGVLKKVEPGTAP